MSDSKQQVKEISVDQLATCKDKDGFQLIDVRTPVEYREVHAVKAKNIPLSSLNPDAVVKQGYTEEPLYVICQKGGRSQQACQLFLDAGHTNVVSVTGGTEAWVDAELPVARGKKAISLERQVRIVAGLLVLTGSLLGIFVSRWFMGLPAFVGAGLTFAGITDTCGMAMILARMPWNQVKSPATD